jgi:tetratricopeptide (TPR) repeat protein
MRRTAVLLVLLSSLFASAQIDKINIAAGTPEDKDLQAISNEQDAQKKLAMLQEFVQKYASNPAAVAFGNLQIAQSYQSSGDLPKALGYGDKALASMPNDLDILVSQTNIAQQMNSDGKVIEYSTRGGKVYNSIGKQPKPDDINETAFAAHNSEDKEANKGSYEFLETAAFNAIADEKNDKTRLAYIEAFNAAFPGSRFEEQVTQYAMYTLGQLNDSARLYAYGEKTLAQNPSSVPTLILMANAYVEDTRPGSVAKAVMFAQKAIETSKGDQPDADASHRSSAGVAHSIIGYAYMKQDKTAAAIPELKTAVGLLKGLDQSSYAIALYRLGFACQKTNHVSDAREALEEAVKIPGPTQQPAKDLLAKLNAAHPPKKQ